MKRKKRRKTKYVAVTVYRPWLPGYSGIRRIQRPLQPKVRVYCQQDDD